MLMTNLLWITGGFFRPIMLSVRIIELLRDLNPRVMLWNPPVPFFYKETHNTLSLLSRWDLSLPFTFAVLSRHPSGHHHHDANIPQLQRLLTSQVSPHLCLPSSTSLKTLSCSTRQHRWTRILVSSLLHQVSLSIPSPILMLVVVNTILIFPSLLCLFYPQYRFCKGWIMKYCFDFPNLICLLFNPTS
jgi:hypothetical protein